MFPRLNNSPESQVSTLRVDSNPRLDADVRGVGAPGSGAPRSAPMAEHARARQFLKTALCQRDQCPAPCGTGTPVAFDSHGEQGKTRTVPGMRMHL
jgi:hypothetical protein